MLYLNKACCLFAFLLLTSEVQAQTDWGRLLSGTIKAGEAITITDEELTKIVNEQVVAMDKANNVCGQNSKYSQRLKRLTKGLQNLSD